MIDGRGSRRVRLNSSEAEWATRRCECGADDACAFARERDAAKADAALAKSLHDVAVRQRDAANWLVEQLTKERDEARAEIANLRGERIAALAEEKAAVEAADQLARERDEARAERDALIGAGCSPEQNALALLDLYAERTRDAEAARDEANANCCFMVQRACDEKLDGYRELGARAAAAENERDSLLNRVDSLTRALRGLLLSRDASWIGGHDWQEAVDDACKALGIEPGEDAE